MQALELQRLAKRHVSGRSGTERWRNKTCIFSHYQVMLIWKNQSVGGINCGSRWVARLEFLPWWDLSSLPFGDWYSLDCRQSCHCWFCNCHFCPVDVRSWWALFWHHLPCCIRVHICATEASVSADDFPSQSTVLLLVMIIYFLNV